MPAKNQVALEAIDKRLRGQGEDITYEPLPRRWVDLIHHLDEQERGTRRTNKRRRKKDAAKAE